jgi:hypothetical protein
MGLIPIEDKDLRIGKAVLSDVDTNPTLASLDPDNFTDNAPLWFYVLAEAQFEWSKRAKSPGSQGNQEPVRLGRVGGRIVAETLIGLILGDGASYLRQAPNWRPEKFRDIAGLIQFALKL